MKWRNGFVFGVWIIHCKTDVLLIGPLNYTDSNTHIKSLINYRLRSGTKILNVEHVVMCQEIIKKGNCLREIAPNKMFDLNGFKGCLWLHKHLSMWFWLLVVNYTIYFLPENSGFLLRENMVATPPYDMKKSIVILLLIFICKAVSRKIVLYLKLKCLITYIVKNV